MSRKIPLYFYGYIFKKNTVFFIDDTFNCLFEYDWQSEEIKFLHCFDELLKGLNYPLFGVDDMTYCGDTIFMFASGQNFIICYDILDKQEIIINMPQFQGKKINIGRVITYGDLVWIFAQDLAQGVCVLDMKKRHIERDITFSESAQKYSGSICEGMNIGEKKSFFTALYGTNTLLEVNFDDKSISDFSVPVSNLHLENVVYDRDVFYMVQMDSPDVYEWNRKKKIVNSYIDTQEKRIENKAANSYHDIICNEESVYIVPWIGSEVVKLDREGGCKRIVMSLKDLDYKLRKRKGMGIFCGFKMIEKKMWSAPYGINAFLSYDTQTGQILAKKVAIDLDFFPIHEQILKRLMCPTGKYGIGENEQISIYDLMTFKSESDDSSTVLSKCGEKIYLEINAGNVRE